MEGVPGCWLFHRACGGLLENMARRFLRYYRTGNGHGNRAKRAGKKQRQQQQAEADRFKAFSLFYRIKGKEATGLAYRIWPQARLCITQHVGFCYLAWMVWRTAWGFNGVCVNRRHRGSLSWGHSLTRLFITRGFTDVVRPVYLTEPECLERLE